jgi:hypothetical protein
MNRQTKFILGSAPAPDAVFRALAENTERTQASDAHFQFRALPKLAARRDSLRPGRARFPIWKILISRIPSFGFRHSLPA